MGLVYDPTTIHTRVETTALEKAVAEGNLRIFAAVRHHNWEGHNLIPGLAELGEVIHFDWGAEGFAADSRWTPADRERMNQLMLERFNEAQKDGATQLFFGYLSGRTVSAATIRKIRDAGAVTVNLALDDRAKFKGRRKNGSWTGVVDIAPAFDLCLTSTESALEKYLVEGANPMFMPEGANPDVYKPNDVPFEYDVSFVGQCYGMRPKLVAELEQRGVKVAAFGEGWPAGPLNIDDMVAMYSKSRINLGFGGVGGGDELVCLKGRDFEIPMAGGLYLTQYNPELESVYELGREIVCYRDTDELVERVKHLLAHPDEAERIRAAGYNRAIGEHAWVHRFKDMLTHMTGSPGFKFQSP
jgi:hypothetical protein